MQIQDQDARPVRADSVTLVVRDDSGAVVHREPMSSVDEEKYKATVLWLGPGTYTVWAEVDLAGWRVTLFGGQVRR